MITSASESQILVVALLTFLLLACGVHNPVYTSGTFNIWVHTENKGEKSVYYFKEVMDTFILIRCGAMVTHRAGSLKRQTPFCILRDMYIYSLSSFDSLQ